MNIPKHKQFLNWLYHFYQSLSRIHKRWLLITIDGILCVIAIIGAFGLRNLELSPPEFWDYAWRVLFLIIIKLFIFQQKGMYRPIVRYTGIDFIAIASQAVLISYIILVFLAYLQGFWALPRSILMIDALLTLVLIVGARVLIRGLFRQLISYSNESSLSKSVVIYGAGVAGSQLARALLHDSVYHLIAFVDDNPELQHHVIEGVRVYLPGKLPQLWKQQSFDTIILAIPSVGGIRKREIIDKLKSLPVTVKTIPSFKQLIAGEVSIKQIRNIDVAELLGRKEVMPYPELLSLNITGKSVLVTGAGGSIGSELCRQVAQLAPKCLVIYELNEFALYQIDCELGEVYPHLSRFAYLGNVTDENNFRRVVCQHQIDTIYHAAAYKHVPLVELNPTQGVYNNVLGTLNVAQTAIACSVSNFVLISTDKAVRPTSIMGLSKRVAELIIQALADFPETRTCFAIVRFGNVLDSSGSVVPRFRQQIAQGKPITVTHPEITRYFMSISEAVRLVMQAGAMAEGGEVFLLDMGQPIRIYDLAVQMIYLSGLEPEKDIEIKFTGLRPGEKLYEELLIDGDNVQATKHPKIFFAKENKLSWENLQTEITSLLAYSKIHDQKEMMRVLKELVPEYSRSLYSEQEVTDK